MAGPYRCPAGHQSEAADYCDVCGEAIGGSAQPAGAGDPGSAAVPQSGDPGSIAAAWAAPAGAPASVAPPGTVSAAGGPTPTAPGAGQVGATGGSASGSDTCVNCGAPRTGRFCEVCGFDSALPPPTRPAGPPPGGAVATGAGEAAGTGPVPATGAAVGTATGAAAGSGWAIAVRADRSWYQRAIAKNGPDAASVTFPPYYAERRFRLHGPEMMIGKRDEREGIHPDIDLRVTPEDIGISRTQAVLRQRADGGWEVVDIGSTNGTTVGDAEDPIAEFTPAPLEPGDQFHIGAWTTITLVRE